MLEIGKYYQQRQLIEVGPLREYNGRMAAEGFKFCAEAEGVSNRVWRYDGSFLLDRSKQSNCDIVSGVQFVPLQDLTQQPKEEIVSTFEIEAGKFYKDRNGDIHGPMTLSGRKSVFVFEDQYGGTYTANGSYIFLEKRDIDLIEEVPNHCDINPEPIMKNNNPTIEEVLSALQRSDEVICKDDIGCSYQIYSQDPISYLLSAKSFEIRVKKPVVKFKWAYQVCGDRYAQVSHEYYADLSEFLGSSSSDDYAFFEPINATRKEF